MYSSSLRRLVWKMLRRRECSDGRWLVEADLSAGELVLARGTAKDLFSGLGRGLRWKGREEVDAWYFMKESGVCNDLE